MVQRHPERSAAESKDPAKLPFGLRREIPECRSGDDVACGKVLFMGPHSATLVNL
jgi:hypothetical protein